MMMTSVTRRRDTSSDRREVRESLLSSDEAPKSPRGLRRFVARLFWPRRRCLCCSMRGLLLIGATALLLFFLVYLPARHYFLVKNHATDLSFLRHDNCPACFGESMCRPLQDGAVRLSGMYQYPVFHFLNTKNVIHGVWRRGPQKDEALVLKKMGHDSHMRSVHMDICMGAHGHERNCIPRRALWAHLSADGDEQVGVHHARKSRADLATCLSERLLEKLKSSFRERSTSPDSEMYLRHDQLMLLYALKFNPEPLLLQTFPYHATSWPFFPRYLGACGQWVAVEDRGRTLAAFAAAAGLPDRLRVASRLLVMARALTVGRDGFALFLGDASWDNVAVDAALRPALVDLSNVLVVDRREAVGPAHAAPFDACAPGADLDTCGITWDVEALCAAKDSDYNLYVVCRTFLAPSHAQGGGLLAELATDPRPGAARLAGLMDRCARPAPGETRQEVAADLARDLDLFEARLAREG